MCSFACPPAAVALFASSICNGLRVLIGSCLFRCRCGQLKDTNASLHAIIGSQRQTATAVPAALLEPSSSAQHVALMAVKQASGSDAAFE